MSGRELTVFGELSTEFMYRGTALQFMEMMQDCWDATKNSEPAYIIMPRRRYVIRRRGKRMVYYALPAWLRDAMRRRA